MYDMMKGLASTSRLGGATGLSMQRNVRGRVEAQGFDPISLTAAARRNGTRLASASRGCDPRACSQRRSARAI